MNYLILLLTSLIFSAVGFYKYLYFISLGYGLSVAGIGAAVFFLFKGQPGPGEAALCLLLVLYGLRLSGYLMLREAKSASYRKAVNPELKRSEAVSPGRKAAIWIPCAILYFLQTSPVFFRLGNGAPADAALWPGAAVMAFGLILETAADLQKSKAKKVCPHRFVDTGLYRLVRCPNYLGEMLFWLGVLISGVTALRGPLQWSAALLGFFCIVFVMFSGARRLELRQDRNYGKAPEYQRYCKTVPILLPFVPLYSVKKYKFLVA